MRNSENNNSNQEKAWKSGKIFGKETRRPRGNEPWWMRDEEKNNPRVLPEYKPWWSAENPIVDSKLKLDELRHEAARRGLPTKGKKDELIHAIEISNRIYDLSDAGFISPSYTFNDIENANTPSCYPDSYESPESIAALKAMAFQQQAPSA
eukprot:gene3065-6008_t